MKLNINSKELLALYNILYDRFEGPDGRTVTDYKEGDPRAARASSLFQIYGRLRALIVTALSQSSLEDPIDSWMRREKQKIDKLVKQNSEITPPVPPSSIVVNNILTDDEDEVSTDAREYPRQRKGRPPPPVIPNLGGNKHKRRKR